MALGARRIADAGVLTRRMNALEPLGETSVLCVDKTGTLTQNRMSVRALYSGETLQLIDEATSHIDEGQHELLEYLVLASEVDAFDPMERAFHETGNRCLANTEHLHADWSLLHEYSLSPGLPAMAHGWDAPQLDHRPVACKGAPEAVCALCRLDAAHTAAILSRAAQIASGGLRVLGVAKARHYGVDWPARQHDFDFSFVGLVGLVDPVRPDAAGAIAECQAAGIRVVMITGDYPSTAHAIAAEVGIGAGRIVTGDELAAWDDAQVRGAIATTDVFARVRPEQKLRLIEAFKARGNVVAMTGDGVNDAPALKAAHIGIAMGRRGTELAREVAALVLLRDDFAPIVAAIRLGRRIYDNLGQAISYTVAVHIPMVAAAMIPVILGWPVMLAPLHIVFLELIINPVCSLVFENEPERRDLMKRPPHRTQKALLSNAAFVRSAAAGVVLALIVLAVYAATVATRHDVSLARTFAFLVLVGGNVALIFAVRVIASRSMFRPAGVANNYIGLVLALTATALLLLMTVPTLARLFSLVPLLALYVFK
ncbi:cation transport ATPase [Caballeronia choica]|jgi:Ca2+-transporting ATPase|uniref:P-type Cu(+) transporter n=1 Tax=Caballeronia choica TaxID=326476 RepID=A0A158KSS3_9BURK|nr:cation transport ATPase [Caballeronia choica]